MSELIQIQKELTFKDVSPEWAEAIDNTDNLSQAMQYVREKFDRNYGCTLCLVGEAHGDRATYAFAGKAHCETCLSFASVRTMVSALTGKWRETYSKVSQADLRLWQREFMAHWNEAHGESRCQS